jgi:hypothetical protein
MIKLQAAWGGFLLGCVAGAITGLFFHNSDWLGGYASWQRRMIRLAHIGFINLSFALTARTLGLDAGLQSTSTCCLRERCPVPVVWRYATESPGLRAVSGSLADRLRGYVHGYRQKSGWKPQPHTVLHPSEDGRKAILFKY